MQLFKVRIKLCLLIGISACGSGKPNAINEQITQHEGIKKSTTYLYIGGMDSDNTMEENIKRYDKKGRIQEERWIKHETFASYGKIDKWRSTYYVYANKDTSYQYNVKYSGDTSYCIVRIYNEGRLTREETFYDRTKENLCQLDLYFYNEQNQKYRWRREIYGPRTDRISDDLYFYNPEGNLMHIKRFRYDSTLYCWEDFEFDNGLLVEESRTIPNSRGYGEYIKIYDYEDTSLFKITNYYSDRTNIREETVYKYNASGQKEKMLFYIKGILSEQTLYKYDNKGRLIVETWDNNRNKRVTDYEYW